jgi:hypothetical protein
MPPAIATTRQSMDNPRAISKVEIKSIAVAVYQTYQSYVDIKISGINMKP